RGRAERDDAGARGVRDGPADRVADREAEQREQDDDHQRQQERVPLVRGDLAVEGLGHGLLGSGPGGAARQEAGAVGSVVPADPVGAGGAGGGVPPPKPRSTTGVWDASGSASKNSRGLKTPTPAVMLLGIVAIEVL